MQNSSSHNAYISQKTPINFLYLSIWGALLGSALACVDLAVTGLFLHSFASDTIPKVFFIAGFIGFLMAFVISFVQKYVVIARSAGIFFTLLSLVSLWLFGLIGGLNPEDKTFTEAIFWSFVLLYPVNSLSLYLFESVFTHLFDLRMAKRYSHRATTGLMLAAGLILLSILLFQPNNAATTATFLSNLLGVGVVLLVLSTLLLWFMGIFFTNLHQISADLKEIRAKNTFFQLIEQPYVIWLALFLGLSVMLSVCIDYFFWYIIVHRYNIYGVKIENLENFSSLISFLAVLLGVSVLIAMMVKSFFLKGIIRNYGLKTSLLVFPVATSIFLFLAWVASLVGSLSSVGSTLQQNALAFLFIFLCLTKIIKDIVDSALKMPVFRRYLLPIDSDLRFDLQSKLEGEVRHIAIWATGILLMVYHTFLDNLVGVISLGLLLIIALIWVVFNLHKEYRRILEDTLNAESQNTSSEVTNQIPKSVARQILQNLHNVSPNQLPVHLNLLMILNPVLYRSAVLKLLDDQQSTLKNTLSSYEQKVQKVFSDYTLDDLAVLLGIPNPQVYYFKAKLPLDEEIRHLMHQLDQQILANREQEERRLQGQVLKEALQGLLKRWEREVRQVAFNINEDAQRIVLLQAGRLCILEAIPMLAMLMNSRYFPVLENNRLIKQTYSLLRGAEFRLERIKYIRQLTFSKQEDERIFGALLTIYASQEAQEELLPNLLQDTSYAVRYQALVATSSTQQAHLYYKLIDKLNEPLYSNAAFAAIVAIGEPIFSYLENAFYLTGQSQIIQLRIIQVYGRLGTPKAISLLLGHLSDSNQNISLLALDMLSRCGRKMSEESASFINVELRNTCEKLVWNLAIFITIEKYGIDELLKEALEAEIKSNYDEVFSLLALLYEPASIAIVRTSLSSGEAERGEFARELLNIVLADTVKPVLLPLLDVSTSYSEKIQELQDEYPMEAVTKLNQAEALINIIQRDYKNINRWTKACALAALADLENFHDTSIFIANIVNPNKLISEIAYQFLYEQDANTFNENLDFLCGKENHPITVALAQSMSYLQDIHAPREARTRFEMVKFLRNVKNFQGVRGITLSALAELMEWQFFSKGQLMASYQKIEEMDYFLVYQGQLNLSSKGIILQIFKSKDFVHDLFYINENINEVHLFAQTDCIVFKINRADFQTLISVQDEIPLAMLEYTRLQYDLVNQLHQSKLLPTADTLALNNIIQMVEDFEVSAGTEVAQYPFSEQLDVWVVQEGVLSLRSSQKEFRIERGVLNPAHFQEEALSNLQLKALTPARLFKFPKEQLVQLDQDLGEVLFFRRIEGIQDLASFTLLEIALRAELKSFSAGEKLIAYDQAQDLDVWMVLEGELQVTLLLSNHTEEVITYNKRTMLHKWSFLEKEIINLKIEATHNSRVYFMPKDDFQELLIRFDQLALSLLKVQYPDTLYPIASFLRQVPELKVLSMIELLELASDIQVKYYLPNDRIALYNEVENCDFFILYAGKVRIQRGKRQFIDKNEKEIIYSSLIPEDMPNQLRMIAQDNVTLYLVRRAEFTRFLEKPAWRHILKIEDTPVLIE